MIIKVCYSIYIFCVYLAIEKLAKDYDVLVTSKLDENQYKPNKC